LAGRTASVIAASVFAAPVFATPVNATQVNALCLIDLACHQDGSPERRNPSFASAKTSK